MRFGMEKSLGPVSYESPRSPLATGAPTPEAWHERRFSDETAHAIDQAVQRIVETMFDRTVAILKQHRDLLESGARLLLEQETLDEPRLREFKEKIRPVVDDSAVTLSPHPAS
jgi:cell division protease FtsH